jgi:hypothetical protein
VSKTHEPLQVREEIFDSAESSVIFGTWARSVEEPLEIGQVVTAPCSRGSVRGGAKLEVFDYYGLAGERPN